MTGYQIVSNTELWNGRSALSGMGCI